MMRAPILLALLLASLPLRADPRDPLLRLETGMHTAPVTSLAADRAGRYLVTGSTDGTVRIWDLRGYALLRTLRPPAGDTPFDGAVFAVAVAPDGDTVAAAGITRFFDAALDNSDSVYLFDRSSGRMVRRLAGLPSQSRSGGADAEAITSLAFAPDGARLAVARGWGLAHVLRVPGGVPQAGELPADDQIYAADMDRRGRLVLCSLGDSGVTAWLYDDALHLLAKALIAQEGKVARARFSPDGTRIAVGYADRARVDVLAADDLRLLYRPDTAGLGNGDLRAVAWSMDGGQLFAAGTAGRGAPTIRRWEQGGRGAARDLPIARQGFRDLLALPGGKLAFAADDPAWGVLGPGGEVLHLEPASGAAFAGLPGELRLSAAGDVVQVQLAAQPGPRPLPAVTARFSVAERVLSVPAPADPALLPPRAAAPEVPANDWDGTCRAISPDGERVALCTGGSITVYDRYRNQRYAVSLPVVAAALNYSADGRLLVAALRDGTLRWYAASDGQELLALFVHRDRRRWVAWTPAGLYDAAVGGEDLVGWQVNPEGVAAAEFFPASRFRQRFYQPEAIRRSLGPPAGPGPAATPPPSTKPTPQSSPPAVQLKGLLPPVVHVLSPVDGAVVAQSTVELRVAVASPSGAAVTAVRVLVNGREAARTRGLVDQDAPPPPPGGEAVRTVPVALPDGESQVAVLAETASGAGPPAVLHLRRQAAPAAFEIRPRLYVLAVGVSQYRRPDLRLEFAAKDARDLSAALRAQKGRLYRDVDVRLLTDEQASRDNILDGLEWLQRQTTSQDVAVLFLSGHGLNDPATGQYQFLPHDADPDRVLRTLLGGPLLENALATIAGKVVVFLDTCHAGNLLPERTLRGGGDLTRFVNELASSERGVVVFTSATGRQSAQEAKEWGNGAFTKALVEGLGGRADYQKTGRITVNMLDLYVSERVKDLTRGTQTPATARPSTVPDFPLAIAP